MSTKTIPASHRDILDKNQVVALATKGPNGEPQVTALWFLAENDIIRMSINTKRQKAKNLQRDPSCSAFFMDPDNPYRTLEIRGQVDIAPDPDYAFADKVGARYGASLKDMDSEDEIRMIFTLKPDNVITYG